MIMKLNMEQYVLKLFKVTINNDPEMTLTHFKKMLKLAKLVFVLTVGPGDGKREKVYTCSSQIV